MCENLSGFATSVQKLSLRGTGIQRQFSFKTKKRKQTYMIVTFTCYQKQFAITSVQNKTEGEYLDLFYLLSQY